MLIMLASVVWSQGEQANYDQEFVPTQPEQLKSDLWDASSDPLRLYDLIRRGDQQKQSSFVYDTLNAMRKKKPDNAVVLAAYCFAYKIAQGEYDEPSRRQFRSFTPLDEEQYVNTLLKAYRLNPSLWLTYAVEGHSLMDSPYADRKALALLKTAVKLAPDISYTHTLLGEAYAVYDTPYQSFQKAAYQYQTARHLQPVSAHNADLLFDLYDVRLPDHKKAEDAKQYLLSTVPPGYQFKPNFQARLAKY